MTCKQSFSNQSVHTEFAKSHCRDVFDGDIRVGTEFEVNDARDIADTIVSREDLTFNTMHYHSRLTTRQTIEMTLLTAVILHVLKSDRKDKSLAGVKAYLSTGTSVEGAHAIFDEMLHSEHPYAAEYATDMIDMHGIEMGIVFIAFALDSLNLYLSK
jgi:hypothetical protein